MSKKTYVSLDRLSTFLSNLSTKFAALAHKHTISDITDYVVDTELSSTSINPVQNKVLDAEFDAVSEAMNALETAIDGKADSSHIHSNYVPTSRTVNGKSLTSNITLSASDVGALPSTTTIPSIDGLATETYVDDIASTKVDKVSGKGLSANDYTTTEKNKLSGIASGAEVNQNAFSNIVVGSTTIVADSKTDSLTIAAGTGISVSGDTTNDKVTITNSGVCSIATGSTNGTISVNTNGTSANVAVKGLGSAAYTASTAYDAAGTAKTKADAALASAKTYTDEKISALLDGADDTTLDSIKELADAIKENDTAIDALNDIAAGKANATHTHPIADVSGLQSALDGKAASSHGTHVSYSTTAPVMNGTASVGSATTVARSDHKHPTDTSRASKTEFDTHVADATKHITSTERTNWNAAKTHADTAHAPSDAEKNQNAFSNIAVSGQNTVAADTATDTVTFAGSNVTITTDSTNDKVTFTVADGSTSAKGVVKLTNSTSSSSTTTAATPNSVKSAYDLANTANNAAATAQTTADGKADKSHTHTVANITDLTATATELNYMDGVTSNVQTQLDGKAASGHTHKYAGSSSAGGAATSANKVNQSLIVQLNGGTTEGTNKFTFNGSAAKSVNITPSAIGAALSSHTHDDIYYTETEIDTKIEELNKAIDNKSDSTHIHTASDVGARPDTWFPTTDEIGALPVINANDVSGDMNVVFQQGAHLAFYKTNTNTLNTPYNTYKDDGETRLTDLTYATILSYASGTNYGIQVSFTSGGNRIFVRRLNNGTIGDWGVLYGENTKPTADDIGAVPSTRTINGKELNGNVVLSASDVNARPDTWFPTASEIGAASANHTHEAITNDEIDEICSYSITT